MGLSSTPLVFRAMRPCTSGSVLHLENGDSPNWGASGSPPTGSTEPGACVCPGGGRAGHLCHQHTLSHSGTVRWPCAPEGEGPTSPSTSRGGGACGQPAACHYTGYWRGPPPGPRTSAWRPAVHPGPVPSPHSLTFSSPSSWLAQAISVCRGVLIPSKGLRARARCPPLKFQQLGLRHQ